MGRPTVAALALAVALCLMGLGAPRLAAQDGGRLRGEFWTDLAGVPQHDDPYPLPLAVAATRLMEEAAYVYSGMIFGFDFEWVPSDKARGLPETFILKPLGAIPAGDPRLAAETTRIEEDRLLGYIAYTPTPSDRALLASSGSSPWRSVQGAGSGPYTKGREGRRMAYEGAIKAGLRELLRSLEPNKPRRVLGRVVFAAQPRIGVAGGDYYVQARLRVLVGEIQSYGVF